MAPGGGDARRRRAVFDKAYFCSMGLNAQGLDPRDAQAWDGIVTKQDLMDEFSWDGDKGPINLTEARTIDITFLRSLMTKVSPHRSNKLTQGTISFARGAIGTHRGLQVDWATFAFESQYIGRYAARDRKRADLVRTPAFAHALRLTQGGGEVARSARDLAQEATCQDNCTMEVQEVEHDTRPHEEARADVEPGSGSQSQVPMYNGVSCSHESYERRNRVYNELADWVKHCRMHMTEQELTEGMAQGSGPGEKENSQAAQLLEASDRELNGPVRASPQLDMNAATHMDISGGQESACLPLPQSWAAPSFEDIRIQNGISFK